MKFKDKPILFGGGAMSYHGIRKSKDIDIIVTERDLIPLLVKFEKNIKDQGGDLGIRLPNIDIWRSVYFFKYEDLIEHTIEEDKYMILNLETLLKLKVIAIPGHEKHLKDVHLISEFLIKKQNTLSNRIHKENQDILKKLSII